MAARGERGRHRITRFSAVVVVALVATLVWAAPASAATRPVDEATQEGEFLWLLNAERGKAGLPPLVSHAGLVADAREWSDVMAAHGDIFHTSTLAADTAASVPDWRRAGENVGMGWSSLSLHQAFYDSTGHRANMLGDYNVVGVGVTHTPQRTFVTFRFAKSASAPVPPPPADPDEPPYAGFLDVLSSTYYGPAVRWMKDVSLTTGVGGTDYYQPDRSVSRGEMAVFLHRLAGEPAPARSHPFVDVPRGVFYERAVSWMWSVGLTTGVGGSNRYEPDAPVTRAQMAAMLHRYAATPDAWPRHGFVDVATTHYADEAVTWMAAYGLTTGVAGSNRYEPESPVTRGQMATFLHRLVSTPSALGPGSIAVAVS